MGTGCLVDQALALQLALFGAEPLGGGGVHAQAVVTADEHRLGPHIAGGGVHRRDEGQGGHQNLIALAQARHHGGQMQAGGAAVAGHGPGHTHITGDGVFKVAHLAAAGGHPFADHRFVHIFLFIALEIGYRQGNKARHMYKPSFLCLLTGPAHPAGHPASCPYCTAFSGRAGKQFVIFQDFCAISLTG